ncbi:hypothetical protein AB4Y36_37975, partial [Paraburkholderia sp. BR10936]
MKPALPMRVLLVFCAIAAAGAGYRVLVAARQMPAQVVALDSQRRIDMHARLDARRHTHATEAAAKAAATATASAASASASSAAHAKLVSLRAPL